MMTDAMFEKYKKTTPWIDENYKEDPKTPWIRVGLKETAPEDVKEAYAEVLEYEKNMWERGVK